MKVGFDVWAQVSLGYMYSTGEGVPQDYGVLCQNSALLK